MPNLVNQLIPSRLAFFYRRSLCPSSPSFKHIPSYLTTYHTHKKGYGDRLFFCGVKDISPTWDEFRNMLISITVDSLLAARYRAPKRSGPEATAWSYHRQKQLRQVKEREGKSTYLEPVFAWWLQG